jgi:hypothetical protein
MVKVYVQQKNIYKMFGCGCFSKVRFTWKYIKIIFLFYKNYFWYQYIKIIWKYKKQIWSQEKNKKKLNFKKSAFETQKQTKFYKTQLKKHVKIYS